ncbi:toxin C-terminal domain-containing protein [Variovorax sp. IB41]|uniref:toxin C-terminal domain-containing protein n=1 Tax=Variovorax sp. IB41 TaxID=2779370 RepID=UPI0018E81A95|nr:hypothetical protein [Variovorax sp. IB41]
MKAQPVYFNPNAKEEEERFIMPDVGSGDGSGSHNGGFWKAASAPEELGKKTTRSGTTQK